MACERGGRRKHADADAVIARLVEWQARFGAPPRQADWQPRADGPPSVWEREFPHWPSVRDVRRAWGSWTAAHAAAGMHAHHRRWAEERIIAALRAWAQTHGRPPRAADW